MKGQCEVNGCTNQARFALYRTDPDGEKKWIHVCQTHEKEIGAENLQRAGGYTKTIRFDRVSKRGEAPL